MKVHMLYDQGTARDAEDGLIFYPPHYYGITDGVCGVYLPNEGPKMFSGRTGGQLASHIVNKSFATAVFRDSSEKILRTANYQMYELAEHDGLPFYNTAFLPGACFSVCSLGDSEIEIIQGGDSLAVWEMKDGSIGGTPNQMYEYEKFLRDTIKQLMVKHEGNRQKMWEEFRPILIERRMAGINTQEGKVCVLNGHPEFKDFWQRFTLNLKDVKLIILFTDGLVPFELTDNSAQMAKEVINLYHMGFHHHDGKLHEKGLHSVLAWTRHLAMSEKSQTHEDFPEAMAIAIEF